MKVKIFIVIMLLAMGTSLWAVPAWPGWITMTQPDSTEIELKQIGDEFYHYWINRDGKEVEQDEDGWWREVTDTLTTEQRRQRFIDARRRMSTLDSPDT